MNSKKGKKSRASKPVNPNPPQNVDTKSEDSKIDEQSVENLESELKCDEKGVEAVSDVPAVEDKQDTPKKPKRNRGKKKKQDRDNVTENQEENVQEVVTQDSKVVESIENVPEVTPSVRKNKNKKKDKDVIAEGEIISEDNVIIPPEIPFETKEPAIMSLTEIKEPTVIPIDDQEFKTPKKKNKKKKRHDSEKSEHTEDPVSCTAAFQKILDTEDEKITDKNDISVEDTAKNKEKSKEVVSISKNKEMIASATMKDQQQEIKVDEGIKSKKNKKEKKHPAKIDTDTIQDQNPPILPQQHEDITLCSSSTSVEVNELITPAEKTDIVINLAEIQPLSEVEEKGKIAKPVEKKRKGKEEHASRTDEPIHQESEKVIQKTKSPTLSTDIITETPKQTKIEPEVKQSNVLEKDIDTTDSKNRSKKSSSKGKGKHIECKDNVKIPLPTDLKDPKGDVTTQEMNKDVKITILPTEVKDFVTTKIDQDSKTSDENKMEVHRNIENTGYQDSPISDNIQVISMNIDEIESEIVCEAVPDVHYPRATSQQLLDDNNNMVIQEIVTDNFKLDLPVFTNAPLVQGSGETPVDTPDKLIAGIAIKEIISPPEVKAEKTDLKSKMMEVNQDMEELRLSIEKSLAELTALEKTEEDGKEIKTEGKSTTKGTDCEPAPVNIENSGQYEEITKSIVDNLSKESLSNIVDTTNEPVPALSILTDSTDEKSSEVQVSDTPPVCPARKDHKGKGKHKKKGKHDTAQTTPGSTAASVTTATATDSQGNATSSSAEKGTQQETKKDEKSEQKSETTKEKGKQQSDEIAHDNETFSNSDFEPIENFEDALTSSVDDVNKTFEMIVNDQSDTAVPQAWTNPEINIIAPEDSSTKQKDEKINPVSQPKNLLGHPDIPVSSNKTDYKKEKDKTPNTKQAKVRIRDSVAIEDSKQSKESQTENKRKLKVNDTFSQIINHNEEYVYKYSFRKVFLPSSCHVCKKDLVDNRVPCNYCSLVFYCGAKHKCEDWPEHQALCFAVSTIVHLKNQKHIYADVTDAIGYDYRVIRMQMILSCEKMMKRRLVACEQEMFLYPRLCAAPSCREWRQAKLKDCDRCGQISFCSPAHLPASHARWCTSYDLYRKLVTHQQTLGRLEPKLPTRVMTDKYQLPEKMNEVLAAIYEEKIDMNDIQYAALTQVATAPLTAAFAHQMPKTFKSSYTIHVVNAELQFEADALNKWETFFLHLRADVKDLTVVLIGTDLNPSRLPLELLGKIQLCANCRQSNRRVQFSFQDKTYFDYRRSDEYVYPDLVCAFNAGIYRTSRSTLKNTWPAAINAILTLKCPFVSTSYTISEAQKDLRTIIEVSKVPYEVLAEPKYNNFASVRPDRNFISDDEMPLLFKNYCFFVVRGVKDSLV